MSRKETDYGWFAKNENPLVFPWQDQETVLFKDPQRSSNAIVVDDEDSDGPSFGPDASGSRGPTTPKSAGTSSSPNASGTGGALGTSGGATGSAGTPRDANDSLDPAPFNSPPYTTSTLASKGQVGITYVFGGQMRSDSVPHNITEQDIQRRAANTFRVKMDGYWVATVTQGTGRVGALQNGDYVSLNPATALDIQRVVQARTTAAEKGEKCVDKRALVTGTARTDWLAIQFVREKFIEWGEFAAQLEADKMIHIVIDGGARPNPGAAGWGELMRQSGRYTQNWGHWDMSSSNAMELLAVTEALAIIPDQMHVWIMTDSAYVKNGITQWVSNWRRNGWKNAG
jgi:hypothetical protein